MDSKYNYFYLCNEIYCYPGTNVLKKQKNITNPESLIIFERTLTSLRQREFIRYVVGIN